MRPLLAIFALALSGCLTAQQEVNDCLPAAIAAREVMQKQGVPARVLVVHWKDGDHAGAKIRGHAYTVFRYGQPFAYDKNFGSIALSPATDLAVPAEVAFDANMRRGHFGLVTKAEYLDQEGT
jgi:hypothetical protein